MIDMSAEQAAQHILKGDIKSLQLIPPVAIKLLKLTNDEFAMISDLSRIIETEPTLSAKVLRNVNSAAFALPNKITSIHRAVSLLGFSAVRQIALNQLFYQKLITHQSGQKFNQLFFWQHCLFVASLSRSIAVALKHPDPDLVYTAGLLHDIGKIVLESHGRLTYSDFINSISNNNGSSAKEEDERRFFGLTHAEIGYLFCLEWELPESIAAVVAYHHHVPDHLSGQTAFNTEIAIISFANYIASMQGVGSTQIDYQILLDQATLQTINFSQLDFEELLRQVDLEMESTREFYGIEFPCITKLRATLVMAIVNNQQINDQLTTSSPAKNFSTHLTLPHKSLDPNEFVPWTLDAIQDHFDFDRIIMLTVDPKRRSLIPSHWQKKSILAADLQNFEINISTVSGTLLHCLRDKIPVIINQHTLTNKQILQHLNVSEFIAIPITHQHRLIAVFYADNSISRKAMHQQHLTDITPLANELGIALSHAKQYEAEKKRAQIDPLTQLFNKRMIDNFLVQLFQEDEQQKRKLAVGFVDIDHFKKLNDLCGHQAGDDAIRIVADILRNLTRPRDFIGRYGGEEFLFVLKNTDKTGALGYAERIRLEIEQQGKSLQNRFHNHALTASIGVTMYNQQVKHYTDMIEAADQAMYRAKREGRNKVILINSVPHKTANINFAQ